MDGDTIIMMKNHTIFTPFYHHIHTIFTSYLHHIYIIFPPYYHHIIIILSACYKAQPELCARYFTYPLSYEFRQCWVDDVSFSREDMETQCESAIIILGGLCNFSLRFVMMLM